MLMMGGHHEILETIKSPIYESDGTIIGILGISHDITERKRTLEEKEDLIASLEKALDEVNTLRDFIPICANCKNIRNDDGYWEKIETYISKHSGSQFSHGICEPCAKELYPDFYDD